VSPKLKFPSSCLEDMQRCFVLGVFESDDCLHVWSFERAVWTRDGATRHVGSLCCREAEALPPEHTGVGKVVGKQSRRASPTPPTVAPPDMLREPIACERHQRAQ
jgi:hypothetical protein